MNLNLGDKVSNNTPQSSAARCGYEAVVKRLQEWEDLDVNLESLTR